MRRRTALQLLAAGAAARAAGEPDVIDLYTGGQDGYHSYRIPALLVTKRGSVLAFCEARKNGAGDAGNIDLVVKRSTDGGRNWSPMRVVHEEGGDAEITIGNPCPLLQRSTGTVHLMMTRNNQRIFHSRSTDDGVTFSTPSEITETLRSFNFPWTRVGAGPGHGIELKSGRLLVPLWLNERIRFNYRSAVVYSDDRGRTWKAGGLIDANIPDTNECMAVERSDGAVLLNMRAQGSRRRSVAVSKDGGITWSAPEYAEALIDPVCQASILRVDREGRSRMLFANPASEKREKMTLRISYDDGRTWPVAKVLYEGPSGYSDLASTPDGAILCLYEAGVSRYAEGLRLARLNLAALEK